MLRKVGIYLSTSRQTVTSRNKFFSKADVRPLNVACEVLVGNTG